MIQRGTKCGNFHEKGRHHGLNFSSIDHVPMSNSINTNHAQVVIIEKRSIVRRLTSQPAADNDRGIQEWHRALPSKDNSTLINENHANT